MRDTGYSPERAAGHDELVLDVIRTLVSKGVECRELPPDGHRPDIQLADGHYIDVKTDNHHKGNLAIELDSWMTYRHIETVELRRVYIVWCARPVIECWTVHTVDSLAQHIAKGPRRRSGMGSNDDWYLFHNPVGTMFSDFFS